MCAYMGKFYFRLEPLVFPFVFDFFLTIWQNRARIHDQGIELSSFFLNWFFGRHFRSSHCRNKCIIYHCRTAFFISFLFFISNFLTVFCFISKRVAFNEWTGQTMALGSFSGACHSTDAQVYFLLFIPEVFFNNRGVALIRRRVFSAGKDYLCV